MPDVTYIPNQSHADLLAHVATQTAQINAIIGTLYTVAQPLRGEAPTPITCHDVADAVEKAVAQLGGATKVLSDVVANQTGEMKSDDPSVVEESVTDEPTPVEHYESQPVEEHVEGTEE